MPSWMGRYQSGQLGLTVTQLTFVFVGSNPALPTEQKEEVASLSRGNFFFYFLFLTGQRAGQEKKATCIST